jgi:hypothetical protein
MASLQSQTFDGLVSGVNLAAPAHTIDDTQARYIQDFLLDRPGLLVRRGPIREAVGFPAFTEKATGISGTINPVGGYRLAILSGDDASGNIEFLSSTFSAVDGTLAWGSTLPDNPYKLFDSKPAMGGGVCLGTARQYSATTPDERLAFWYGGTKADYSTGTITLTAGSTTVAGSGTSWTANVTAGMYLFASYTDANMGRGQLALVGVVKSVDNDTQITLVGNSPFTSSAGTTYLLSSLKGFQFRVAKGRITTTTSTTTVTGATTKFISQFMDEVVLQSSGTLTNASPTVTGIATTAALKRGMRITGTNVPANTYINSVDSGTQITMSANATGSGAQTLTYKHTWNIYRASDMTWVGRVALVNNEISITLAANSAIALNNERFIALNGTGDWSTDTDAVDHKIGFLNATYAGRQWYANNGRTLAQTSRVWFSEAGDAEAVDLSDYDGDFINAFSTVDTDTPIKAIVPAYNALVVIKENETFAISGTSPTTFNLKKIYDDGTLAGMSAAAYGGGVIWAGREGILFYDGINTTNLTEEKLGQYYKNAIRSMEPQTHRMWSMVVRQHYFLHIESYTPDVAVIKGSTSATPSAITIVINMVTGAISFFTNTAIRGAVETPSDAGKNVLFIMNSSTRAYICDAFDIFDEDGLDEILADGTSQPFYVYGDDEFTTEATFNGVADKKYFSPVVFDARAKVERLRVYSQGQGGGAASVNVRAGIYSDTAGQPDALLGTTDVVALVQDDGPAFRDYTFATPLELAAGTYWIGVQVETSGRVKFFQGATADQMVEADDAYSDALENPFGAHTDTIGPLVACAVVRSVGPDAYLESKKFTFGDSLRKKLFKQLTLNYVAQGDVVHLDTVLGLQNIGRTARANFPTTVFTWNQLATTVGTWDDLAELYPTWDSLTEANFRPKRIKFLKRNQMMSFRVWQASPAVTQLRLGPFQILYKWQRLGRI